MSATNKQLTLYIFFVYGCLMISVKVWNIINVSLALVGILLFLNFMGVSLPTLGQAQYLLDKEDPLCLVQIGDETTSWNNLDRCCLEARKLSLCFPETINLEEGRVDWKCSAGVNGYLLNNKAYNYCRQQPFW